MSIPVVVGSTGLPVTNSSSGPGIPVVSTNNGLPVVQVSSGGMAVTGLSPSPPSAATWSATLKNGTITLSNGDLTATGEVGGPTDAAGLSSNAITNGQKGYFEVTCVAGTSGENGVGFGNSSTSFADGNWLGIDGNSLCTFSGGNTYTGGTNIAHLSSFSAGDTLGIAIDRANNGYWIINITTGGVWVPGTYDPSTNTGGLSISAITGDLYPGYSIGYQADAGSFTGNFGASAFAGTVPSGFVAWNSL